VDTSSSSSNALKGLGLVLLIVGLLALAGGVVYLTVATDKLPSFMGQIAHLKGHRSKRGLAGVVGGVVFLIGGSLALARSRA